MDNYGNQKIVQKKTKTVLKIFKKQKLKKKKKVGSHINLAKVFLNLLNLKLKVITAEKVSKYEFNLVCIWTLFMH